MTDITTIVKDAPTYSELADIAGELAARVQELEADRDAIAKILHGQAIEHSGYEMQAPRVQLLANRSSSQGRWLVRKQLRIKELEAALSAMVKRWEGDHMTYFATRPFTPESGTYYRQRDCPEVKVARIVLGEGRP